MAYYKPCFNCAADKAACARRQEVRDAIAGLNVTAINFRCDIRQPMFRPGQRVEFDWISYDDEAAFYCGDGEETVTFFGTVMHEKAGNKRFAIRVDPDQECDSITPKDVFKTGGDFTSVRPADMRALGTPDRTICHVCAAYDDDEADKRSKCLQGDYFNAGPACLVNKAAK
jgi:hypothetical protein